MKEGTVTSIRAARVRTTYQSKVEWVPVRHVIVRPAAQRRFDPLQAKRIADGFDPDMVGFPAVWELPHRANEQPRYHVIDGQHRIAAVRIALGEDQSMECEVIRGIDYPRAAAIFRGRNARRNPKPIDDFLIGVTAEDPECLAIHGILKSLGLRVAHGGTGENLITAVMTLRRLYRMEADADRGKLLRTVLTLAAEAWGRGSEGFQGDILTGLGLFLARHGDELDDEGRAGLERKLRGYKGGALGLLGSARALRAAIGSSTANCVARQVVTAYNVGRSKFRLPEWGEKR